jgi:hypothetical protein
MPKVRHLINLSAHIASTFGKSQPRRALWRQLSVYYIVTICTDTVSDRQREPSPGSRQVGYEPSGWRRSGLSDLNTSSPEAVHLGFCAL